MLGPGRPESPRRSAERKRCATRESGDRGWGAGGRLCQVFSRGSLRRWLGLLRACWLSRSVSALATRLRSAVCAVACAEGSGHSRRT